MGGYSLEIFKKAIKYAMIKDGVTRKSAQICVGFFVCNEIIGGIMMSNLFEQLTAKLEGTNKQIVFPEALDERILTAASQLSAAGILTPVLIGNEAEVKDRAVTLGSNIEGCKVEK